MRDWRLTRLRRMNGGAISEVLVPGNLTFLPEQSNSTPSFRRFRGMTGLMGLMYTAVRHSRAPQPPRDPMKPPSSR